jgi:hypothetical protein
MSALTPLDDIDYVQVGQGRLGGLIAQSVAESLGKNTDIHYARIDAKVGLINAKGLSLNGSINQLVICVSPKPDRSWQWHQLLIGMLEQKARGELTINQLVFISSTRVYDGIGHGIVYPDTPAIAHSENAKSLLLAEKQITQLARTFHILRCSGLYGHQYQKYSTILASLTGLSHSDLAQSPVRRAAERPRFGVNVEAIGKTVVERLKQDCGASSYSLLTDGYCYYQGTKIPIQQTARFASKYRLLFPGCTTD